MKTKKLWLGIALSGALMALAAGAAEKPGFVQVEWSEAAGEKWTVEGLADRASGRQMTRDTVFAICSNTKPVTSVLVMTLVEEGLLNLDDPVSKYFPAFADIKYKGRPPKRAITLRMLITHLSGLQYSVSAPGRNSDMTSYLEQTELAVKKGLRSEPGEAYQYCGLGFQVMGAVIEKVTGRKVSDLMKERIFDPLGMKDTTFYPDAAMLARVAVPYYYPPKGGEPLAYGFSRWTEPLDNPARTAMLSGGLLSTVGDYLKFSQMIVRKGVGLNGRRVLSEKMFDDYLFKRQTPPGDKKDSSFDISFDKGHTGGGKGGLFATHAKWCWADRSCVVSFKAKSPYPPKGMKATLDATGFDGKKTRFRVTDIKTDAGGVTCQVANNEDRHGVGTVRLSVNGKAVATERVELAIGEAKRVTFKVAVAASDKVDVLAE